MRASTGSKSTISPPGSWRSIWATYTEAAAHPARHRHERRNTLTKHTGILAVAALAVAALMISDLADAKRLGGGRSLGAQRSMTPQSPAPTPPSAVAPGAASNPVMPAQPGAGMAKSATPAAAAPAAKSGMSKWLGPIAGLAAGLGLAALLSHFGLSEGF